MARTALYRAFDAQGALLYVGISINALRRIAQHSANAIWFSELAYFEVEWFDTRAEAADAEKAAIQLEAPRFNIVHARDEAARPSLPPMPGIETPPTEPEAAAVKRVGLVGMAFHIFDQPGPPRFQGRIIDAVEPGFVLVEYFGWLTGEPTTRALVSLATIAEGCARQPAERGRWKIYASVADMVDWYQERERSWQIAEDRRCRTSATS